MNIKSKSGKNITVELNPVYNISFSKKLIVSIDGICQEASGQLTSVAMKKKGFYISLGTQKINGKIVDNLYVEIEKTDYEKIRKIVDNQLPEILRKIESGEVKIEEKEEKIDFEGVEMTRKIKIIEGVDQYSVDHVISQLPENLEKEKKQSERNAIAAREAAANGLCHRCGTYCFGDCQ